MIWNWSIVYIVCGILIFLSLGDAKPHVRERRAVSLNLPTEPCQIDRYRCESGKKCIPLKWICDGYSDCDDKLDERNCISTNQNATFGTLTRQEIHEAAKILDDSEERVSPPGCSPNTFSCDKGDKCLKISSLCDTVRDCNDGTDEGNCPANAACESGKFSCDDGVKCLPLTWLCDSIDDCLDRKDEYNCPARQEGISIAKAAEAAAITAAQEAKRAAFGAQELMKSAREAADKAKRAMEIAEATN